MSGELTIDRRSLLASGAVAIGNVAGCAGSRPPDGEVSILAAGSLLLALSDGLGPAVDRPVQIEAHGSVAAARLVATRQRDPTIVSLADTVLFDSILSGQWCVPFASNALVVAYDDTSDGGRRVGAADCWFEPVLDGTARLGRTDPSLDPLGYRTLFMLSLAADHYDRPSLSARLRDRAVISPETELLLRFESGGLDAAVVYRNMAVQRDYPFRELPAAIDLSDPAHRDRYRMTSYDLPDGHTVRGDVIEYGATLRRDTVAGTEVFRRHVDGEYLTAFGFRRPAAYPDFENVPSTIRGELVE